MLPQTVLSSATKEVVIGPDHPFAVIGERINPTGRKSLAAEMKAGDYSRVEADALAQVAAGATMLDVNAGIPLADEPAILAKSIELVQSITDVPLSIDSSIVAALEAGLSVYKGKPLLNSVTGEEERLEQRSSAWSRNMAPLWWQFRTTIRGSREDVDVRFAGCEEDCRAGGRPRHSSLRRRRRPPRDADRCESGQAGQQVLKLVARLRDELGVNSTCGASNLSFGLPESQLPEHDLFCQPWQSARG